LFVNGFREVFMGVTTGIELNKASFYLLTV
jgi:hypothetical protein